MVHEKKSPEKFSSIGFLHFHPKQFYKHSHKHKENCPGWCLTDAETIDWKMKTSVKERGGGGNSHLLMNFILFTVFFFYYWLCFYRIYFLIPYFFLFNKVILKRMIYSQENRCFDHFQNFSQETTEGKEEEASIQNCLWEPVIQVMWSRNSNTMCSDFFVCVSSNMIHWTVNSGRKMLVANLYR